MARSYPRVRELAAASGPGRRPLAQVEPVRRAQRGGDLLVRVVRVEDMAVEVAADRDLVQVDALDDGERLGRQLRLGDRVVHELEVGRELHQRRPVRAGARAHAATWSETRARTRAASARMNAGSSFSDAIRSSSRSSSAALARASTSRSQRISRWSETNPTGQTSTRRTPFAANRSSSSRMSGPSQGSPVELALWNANDQSDTPARSATRRDVASSWSR